VENLARNAGGAVYLETLLVNALFAISGCVWQNNLALQGGDLSFSFYTKGMGKITIESSTFIVSPRDGLLSLIEVSKIDPGVESTFYMIDILKAKKVEITDCQFVSSAQ
jgi:hypothetical protein